jgi:hypothetical protein
MSLDPLSLLVSIAVGSVGFVAFMYGKKMQRLPQILIGLVLMVFPYFVSSNLAVVGIAAALLGVTWLAIRAGW